MSSKLSDSLDMCVPSILVLSMLSTQTATNHVDMISPPGQGAKRRGTKEK
jgi:hypothetical protein